MSDILDVTKDSLARIFPVSFTVAEDRYDNVVSEPNLISWMRGVMLPHEIHHSNSRYSYMISENVPENYGASTTDQDLPYIEFILGGYYIRLSDYWLRLADHCNQAIYATIRVNESQDPFQTLVQGGVEDANGVLKYFHLHEASSETSTEDAINDILNSNEFESVVGQVYCLRILDIDAEGTASIPESSLCVIDGGEVE